MTLGKRSARAGLQVALEFKRGFLGPEFHRHDYAPRTIAGGVNAKACVVPVQSFEHIGSYSNVVPFRIAFTWKRDRLRTARPAEADASAQPRVSEGWCARQGSNLRPTGSKPVALSN